MSASDDAGAAPVLSPLKRAFLALEDAQARLALAEGALREPVAVIGLGCRVPGADSPQALWQLLAEGRDAVGPIPRQRFDIDRFFDPDTEVPGRVAVREAGFIGNVDGFDAAFFGISPREARGMDPQQRLMLEVAWEALEHAGQAPDRLSTTPTGVFVGQASSDYQLLMHKAQDPALLDSHFTSGVAHSVTSGRLSYLLGLQGPSLTVDTACSSSLVALHLACQSLRTRECRMAIAGGVNLMLGEDLFIAFSHSRMLAPDGRCKTFDAAADGFGRGEGCGVVVLKRLCDAEADGDRILAVIRGSAVNQDGPSSGLTAPNGPAQEAVIRAALAMAGVGPNDVSCIEAHGTGTQLGDPLEAQALGHVFGPGRPRGEGQAPLWLGSVKTNLGHLEAAAGIAGFIKLVLSLQARAIPAHLHFRQPSPHIAWDELPFEVPTTMQPWLPVDGRRIGGVSAFGYSGTNAHVVVEEAPARAAAGAPAAPPPGLAAAPLAVADPAPLHLYTLSARDAAALRALAARHAQALAALPAGDDAAMLAAACATANAGRAQFAHRAVVMARSRAELVAALQALAADQPAPGLRSTQLARRDQPRIAFVFTGQGAQYAGMAHGLHAQVPAFREALDDAAAALAPHLPSPLLELLFAPEALSRLDHTSFTQPALFAVEFALARMWSRLGIEPAVVLGHSVGEVAAACAAGVMSLPDAAALVCERARLMGALPAGGAMAAVAATADEVREALRGEAEVDIAAINAPAQTVIAGHAEAVERLCAQWQAGRGWRCQRLKVSHAFHSALMTPMLDAFEARVAGLALAPPRLRLLSNLSGEPATAAELTSATYWRRHVRETVRFADGARALLASKPDVCLEIGPQPALLAFVAQCAREGDTLPALLPSLKRGRPDQEMLLEALAALYLQGAPIDWRAVHAGNPAPPLALPTYPFQRERCWFVARPAPAPQGEPGPAATAPVHPLLGARLPLAAGPQVHQGLVRADAPRWLAHHQVQGRVVMPATAYLDMLLAAARECLGPDTDTLEDVTVQEPMLWPATTESPAGGAPGEAPAGLSRRVQVLVQGPGQGRTEDIAPGPHDGPAASIHSQAGDAAAHEGWTCHVTARFVAAANASAAGGGVPGRAAGGTELLGDLPAPAALRATASVTVGREAFYARLARCGLDFGPWFQTVQRVSRAGSGLALGDVELAPELQAEASAIGHAGYHLHPVLLDGCLQVMAAAVADEEDTALFMPLGIGRYRLHTPPASGRCSAVVRARADARGHAAETRRADVRVFDTDGALVAELVDVQLKRVAADGLARRLQGRGEAGLVHEIVWREIAPAAAPGTPASTSASTSSGTLSSTPNGAASKPAAATGASTAAMLDAVLARLPAAREAVQLERYDAELPRLDRLCGELVAQALVRLGCSGALGERLEAEATALRLGVLPRHRALFARLLQVAGEQGWLAREDEREHEGRTHDRGESPAGPSTWRVQRALSEADPEATAAGFGADSPLAAELELTLRTGRAMAEALRGRQDPLQLLFPGGSTATAERVYRDSPPARFFNGLAAQAVAAAAKTRTAGSRPLRILEIGGGTGGTTAHVLPALVASTTGEPVAAFEYTFTDIGPLFVARARERWGAAHPAMRFQVFDLEHEPGAQGLAAQGYDLVIAANVVHATRDLRRSLARIRGLLAPGGALLMLEACAPQAWFDLTVGFTEGWWLFEDRDLRPHYATLDTEAWRALLAAQGFAPVRAVAGHPGVPGRPGAESLNAMLLAELPAHAATAAADSGAAARRREWLLVTGPATGPGPADGPGGALAAELAARLRRRGDAVERVIIERAPATSLVAQLRAWHAAGRRWHRVLHLASLDEGSGHTAGDAADAETQADVAPTAEPRAAPGVLLGAMRLAQALVTLGAPTRLVLATREAVRCGPADEVAQPEAAALWGLARALRLEHPELRTLAIDLDHSDTALLAEALLAECDDEPTTGDEPERAWRAGTRRVPRLVRPLPQKPPAPEAAAAVAHPAAWRLEPARAGSLEGFVRAPWARRAPGPGEVEIAVEATGLNFKDLLSVLGLYPGEAGPLGGECAGTVCAVGPGVQGLAPGDAVLAFAAGSFASHAVARQEFVQRRPEGMSAEEGAGFAIAYLTAQFCLGHLAQLAPGQTVLVHAAAGGVGLAAVRVAQRAGATVLATAGAPWKRELLQSIGVAHVFDSRSAAFGEQVRAATGGRGVDVVLNSLANELIEPGFTALADGGCFVEIGKRGIKSDAWVQALGRGIRYHVVDWGETAMRAPALVGRLFAELVAAWAQGTLQPLPRHVFALDDAPRAFRFMAQARHAGRVVLRHGAPPAWQPGARGTHLVTGGLSGLGLATAAWLGERGAARLVLVGRRGITPEAQPVLAALRAKGVEVIAEALDVADEAALSALLARVRTAGPPLRGVWHSAGVLDDAALVQQDEKRFETVFAPKVGGALALARLTRADALEAFVMYASVAGVLGSAGQSNHSAANAVLDALAHQRTAMGLPALSVDWGAFSDVGAAADRGIGERLAAQGLATMTPSQGLAELPRLLAGPAQAVVLSIHWLTYLSRVVPGGASALLAEVATASAGPASARMAAGIPARQPSGTGATASATPSAAPVPTGLRAQLAAAPAARRRPLMAAFVRERALAVLGLEAGRAIDPGQPLGELGLDSLLAVELRNALATGLALSLPATLLFDHPSVDALADHLLGELSTHEAAPSVGSSADAGPPASTIVASIEDLSDEEVERQLAARSRSRART